jgi:hypothetical protein
LISGALFIAYGWSWLRFRMDDSSSSGRVVWATSCLTIGGALWIIGLSFLAEMDTPAEIHSSYRSDAYNHCQTYD